MESALKPKSDYFKKTHMQIPAQQLHCFGI